MSKTILRNHLAGFATVTLSLALLISAAALMMYSTRSAVSEQRVSGNDFRTKESFESADAGINKGLIYLNENLNTILVDNDNDGNIDPYTHAEITNVSLGGGAQFNVTYENVNPNDMSLIQVTATGTSADGEVTRTVTQLFGNDLILTGAPTVPFAAKDDVDMGGNMRITNMYDTTTIWAGGDVSFSGSADTMTASASSSAAGLDSDIQANDSTLSDKSGDEFFETFFANSKSNTKNMAGLSLSGTGNDNYSSDLDGVEGKLIWIDQSSGQARINSNVTIGAADNPVILIIDGDFRLNGNATVYGIVYIANDWNNSGGGNMEIHGAAIIEGDFDGQGTPNVIYDPSVLNHLSNQGGSFKRLLGSWRDF